MKTEMQAQFVEFFCLTGNATKAATMAGYSEKTAYVKGCQLKKQFAREIAEQTQQMIVDSIPGALSQLKNLAESAQSESVRLGAVKDILDQGRSQTCGEGGADQHRGAVYGGAETGTRSLNGGGGDRGPWDLNCGMKK